jgi:hypothetical protein
MTFREEALIRRWASPTQFIVHDGENVNSLEVMAGDVQSLADAACKVWGHDKPPDTISVSGAYSDRTPSQCRRCGAYK